MSNRNENTDQLHDVASVAANLKEEVIKQTTEAIQDEVRSVTDKIEAEKKGFLKRLRTWFKLQVDRISNTIIALLAASLMTIAMPYLVKLEMLSELDSPDSALGELVSLSVSEKFDLTSTGISEKNSQMNDSISLIEEKIEKIELTSNNDQYPILAIQLNNLQVSQQKQISEIKRQIDELKKVKLSRLNALPKVTIKLNKLVQQGTYLITASSDESDIKVWLGKVYFFVSMIKINSIDLTTTKQSLNTIYRMDKPIVSSDQRIQDTLLILGTLTDWIKIVKV